MSKRPGLPNAEADAAAENLWFWFPRPIARVNGVAMLAANERGPGWQEADGRRLMAEALELESSRA